jgi:hypothetical protein
MSFTGDGRGYIIKEEPVMSRVQEIVEQLRSLSPAELSELRAWLDEREDQLWDETFAAEVSAGKWDGLAEKALKEHREGKSTPL